MANCGRNLVAVGFDRTNGVGHSDTDNRVYHKKCLKEIKKREQRVCATCGTKIEKILSMIGIGRKIYHLMPTIKEFVEGCDNDEYYAMREEWDRNRHRMISYPTNLTAPKRKQILFQEIKENKDADILSIFLPTRQFLSRDKLLKDFIEGKSIEWKTRRIAFQRKEDSNDDNGIWQPREIWIWKNFLN